MQELSVVMDFTSKVGVILSRRFENHLSQRSNSLALSDGFVLHTFDPLVRLCFARYTFPKDPFPINLPRV